MSFPDMFIVEALTPFQWLAFSPILLIACFSLLGLLLSPAKTAGHAAAVASVFSGGALALYVLVSSFYPAMEVFSKGVLFFDPSSRFFSSVIIIALLATLFISFAFAKRESLSSEIYPLFGFATCGMLIMVSTKDLFMLFIGLEIASLSIYILVGLNRHLKSSAEAALKYFMLGAVASCILLFGISLFYGATGSTLMAGFSPLWGTQLGLNTLPLLTKVALLMILIGFIFKLGGFPFHMWLPDVYAGAPLPVTGFMITAMKAAATGAFFRVCSEIFVLPAGVGSSGTIYKLLAFITFATLIYGSIAGLAQSSLKRILSYSTIVHTGFILLGFLVLMTASDKESIYDALMYYTFFYAIMNIGAFAALVLVIAEDKEDIHLGDLSGLYRINPLLAFCLSAFFISMAGIPPTAGFLSKYYVLSSGISSGHPILVGVGLLASLLSVSFYLRPIVYMYMTYHGPAPLTPSKSIGGWTVVIASALFIFIFGLFPHLLF